MGNLLGLWCAVLSSLNELNGSNPPIIGFSGPYRFLSNFWPCRVVYKGLVFASVEGAYTAAKTTDPMHHRTLAYMSFEKGPGACKKYGRNLELRPYWERHKRPVMYNLLLQKFKCPELQQILLQTGNAYLEEANNWNDTFWGTCNGKGENHLGKLLMHVRAHYERGEN